MVAAANLDLGAQLRAEDVRAIQWPADAVPQGAFQSPDELVGRGLIQPVSQNEPFLPAKLASKEAGAGLPPIIPQGLRAVSVRVNEVIGVAGYVLPGTRVDVVATANPKQVQHARSHAELRSLSSLRTQQYRLDKQKHAASELERPEM